MSFSQYSYCTRIALTPIHETVFKQAFAEMKMPCKHILWAALADTKRQGISQAYYVSWPFNPKKLASNLLTNKHKHDIDS